MDMFSYLLGRSSGGGKGSLKVLVVEELPTTGEANVLYLVPRQVTKTRNVFDEYLYVNEAWELVGTTDIDISGKQDKMQFDSLPTASAENVGKIVQYIGTTNANYTNGYFYICLSDGGDPATYSWENINVQAGGGSNAPVLTSTSGGQPQDIVDAVNVEYQKFLNGEEYHIYGKRDNFFAPLYFCKNVFGTISALASPYVNSGNASGGGAYTYKLNCNVTITSNVITALGNISLQTEEFGSSGQGFYIKTRNTMGYIPTADYHPANKIYVDNDVLSKANGIEKYDGSKTYVVDDVVYSHGNFDRDWKYYKCILDAPTNKYPYSNPTYWQEITLTADQSRLTTKEYTDKTHYENMAGYDATKTKVLKNIQGTLTWVDE